MHQPEMSFARAFDGMHAMFKLALSKHTRVQTLAPLAAPSQRMQRAQSCAILVLSNTR